MKNPITPQFGFECYPALPKRIETRVAKTIRLNPDTNRKLRIAKAKLNMMSDTAVIEQALRLLFRKENIE